MEVPPGTDLRDFCWGACQGRTLGGGPMGPAPPPSPKSAISPHHQFGVDGAKNFAGAEGTGGKLAAFLPGKRSLFSENCICE